MTIYLCVSFGLCVQKETETSSFLFQFLSINDENIFLNAYLTVEYLIERCRSCRSQFYSLRRNILKIKIYYLFVNFPYKTDTTNNTILKSHTIVLHASVIPKTLNGYRLCRALVPRSGFYHSLDSYRTYTNFSNELLYHSNVV